MYAIRTALVCAAALSLSGCVAATVAGTATKATAFTAKTAVKGTAAAGRLATAPLRGDDDDEDD